jgi:serine/threonine protein kinase
MTSSPSECLVSSPREEKNTTLEDFKIIKVIGKGSFGKVFLVSNKKMNKFYAMKRINKDILIEKH